MVKKTTNPTTSTASDGRPFNDAFAALRNFEITSKTGDVDRANVVKRDKQIAEVPPRQDTGVAAVDVAVQIVEFQKLVEDGYGAKQAILDDIDQRLQDDLADKSDIERLADLQAKTDSLMASLSPAMLARQHDFIPQLEAAQEIQARIVALLSRLRVAKTAHAADRLIEAAATVVDRERITQQVDEIERLVDDGAGVLSAQNKLWVNDVSTADRQRVTRAFVSRDKTVDPFELKEEILDYVTNAGKLEFFPRALALRQLADRQRKLLELATPTPEPKVEQPAVIEHTPIVLPDFSDEDLARRAALYAEAADIAHAVAAESDTEKALAHLEDEIAAETARDAERRAQLKAEVAEIDRDSDPAADDDTEKALVHLDDEVARAAVHDAERQAVLAAEIAKIAVTNLDIAVLPAVVKSKKRSRSLIALDVAKKAAETAARADEPESEDVVSEPEIEEIGPKKLERHQKLDAVRDSLQSVRAELEAGSTDVGKMNDALITAGTDLETLFDRTQQGRKQGKKVEKFAAEVGNSLRELHELEHQVEAVTSKLTMADVETPKDEPKAVLVPVEKAVIDPLAQEVEEVKAEPKGVFAKARQRFGHAMEYIWHGWERVKAEEWQGELSPQELGEQETTSLPEKTLRVGAGFFAGLASTVGVAIVPDLVRFISQSRFSETEKAELKAVINAAFGEEVHTTGPEIPETEVALAVRKQQRKERAKELLKGSRRLSLKGKAALAKLMEYEAKSDEETEILRKKIEEILETHITPKISKGKIARETVNTSLMMGSLGTAFLGTAPFFVGLHVIRGPAYGVQSIIERRQKARREKARGERVDDGAMTVLKESFKETFDQLMRRSNKSEFAKSMDQAKAVATLTRILGFSATGLAAHALSDTAVEVAAEAAKAVGVDELLHRAMEHVEAGVSGIHEALFGASEAVPEVEEVVDTGAEAPTDVGVREVDVGGEVYLDTVPENSLVLGGSKYEGISHVLRRVILEQIKADPKAYEYKGHDDLSAFLHAKRLATMLVKNEDQLHNWLTEKAIGRVSMFPTMGEDGKWQITAVVDGKYKMSMKELAARGFIEPERVKSK